jgi:hypothetical protein
MAKLLNEIKDDLHFVKTHTLQPKWYKFLKIFIVLGFLVGYWCLFGWKKALIFLVAFFFLSFIVHMVYRIKTNKSTRSWLDFKVVEQDNQIKAKSIGKFYYSAVVFNAILSIVISQVLG